MYTFTYIELKNKAKMIFSDYNGILYYKQNKNTCFSISLSNDTFKLKNTYYEMLNKIICILSTNQMLSYPYIIRFNFSV